MSVDNVYRLNPSTVVEALVDRWVAWANTVPPVTSSLYLKNFQIKLLESYLKDPKVHFDVCQNPKYRAGPFVDVPLERKQEVADMLTATLARRRQQIDLATDIRNFQDYLVQEAKGQCLDPYYQKVPERLRGLVELIYDYYSRPSVKFFENMFYESEYYDPDLQSLRLFCAPDHKSRQFVMSTPRLPSPNEIEWKIRFNDVQVDELFRLDISPKPLDAIRDLLHVDASTDSLLLPLLSPAPLPATGQNWSGDKIRIRYFGHACLLIEWNGNAVLTDPCIGVKTSMGDVPHYSYEDLPDKIDCVVITHNHHDHFSIETLLRIRHKTRCLVVPRTTGLLNGDMSLKLLAKRIGYRGVVELDALESLPLENGEIISIPFLGEHGDFLTSKTAYVIRAGKERILIGADSDCLDERLYERVSASTGAADTVFLGMECVGAPLSWGQSSFFPVKPDAVQEKTRRYKGSDSVRGLKILEAVKAKRVLNYAMGLEPWIEHLLGLAYTNDSVQLSESRKFLEGAKARGLEAQMLFGKHEFFFDQ